MPKNNCLFQARWLEDERFKHWIRKKVTLLQYAIISVKMSVLPIWQSVRDCFNITCERQKALKKVSF